MLAVSGGGEGAGLGEGNVIRPPSAGLHTVRVSTTDRCCNSDPATSHLPFVYSMFVLLAQNDGNNNVSNHR